MKSKYFTREEFKCKCGCGYNTVDVELLGILEDVRSHFNEPVVINSACRCVEHNTAVGGSVGSQHLLGRAADIVISDIPSRIIHEYLVSTYPDSLGIGLYANFVHTDSRDTKARWDFSQN